MCYQRPTEVHNVQIQKITTRPGIHPKLKAVFGDDANFLVSNISKIT